MSALLKRPDSTLLSSPYYYRFFFSFLNLGISLTIILNSSREVMATASITQEPLGYKEVKGLAANRCGELAAELSLGAHVCSPPGLPRWH